MSKQINQMVNFIMQESHEKVNEIRIRVFLLFLNRIILYFFVFVDGSWFQFRETNVDTEREIKNSGRIQSKGEGCWDPIESVSWRWKMIWMVLWWGIKFLIIIEQDLMQLGKLRFRNSSWGMNCYKFFSSFSSFPKKFTLKHLTQLFLPWFIGYSERFLRKTQWICFRGGIWRGSEEFTCSGFLLFCFESQVYYFLSKRL